MIYLSPFIFHHHREKLEIFEITFKLLQVIDVFTLKIADVEILRRRVWGRRVWRFFLREKLMRARRPAEKFGHDGFELRLRDLRSARAAGERDIFAGIAESQPEDLLRDHFVIEAQHMAERGFAACGVIGQRGEPDPSARISIGVERVVLDDEVEFADERLVAAERCAAARFAAACFHPVDELIAKTAH